MGDTEHLTLNERGIRDASARITRFLTAQKLTEQETARLRLTMEVLLRRVGERFGAGADCALTLRRRFGRAELRADYPGKPFDPTVVGRESEGELWSAQLLTELGLVPEWSWRRGMNRLLLRPRVSSRAAFFASLAALALGAALGMLGGALPEGWTRTLDGAVLTPLLAAFSGVLNVFAPLLLFFAAASLVCGAGDTAAFAPGGKRLLARFLTRTAAWALLGTAAMAALGGIFPGASGLSAAPASSGPPDLRALLLHGDAVCAALFGAMCGAGMLLLGGRAARVREWAEQCAGLFSAIMEALCRLTPLAALAAAARALWRGETAFLTTLWYPLALFALCAFALLLVKLTATALTLRQSPFRLLARIFPPLPAAFFSASAAAAFGETMDNCENSLRIPHEPMLMGLSVGSRLCAPVSALVYSAAAIFLMAGGGMTPGAAQLATLALLGALLAMAAPAAPWMTAGFYGLLAARLGLPADGFAAMAILSVLFAPLAAACSVAYLQMELLAQTKKQGKSQP